jgi:hypothetical protein
VSRSLSEEQLALVVADAAGPLRASAAALLELEGAPAPSPKEALVRVAASLGEARWGEALGHLSRARETARLPPGAAAATLFGLIDLAAAMRVRALGLSR